MAAEKLTIAVPRSRDGKLRKFLRARQTKLQSEKIVKALQSHIEAIVRGAPGRSIEIGSTTLRIIDVSGGRVFNEERAKKKLRQALSPFIKTRTVETLDIDAATMALGEEALSEFWEDQPGYEQLRVT